jgi:replication initiation and membrane attachment protein DnaB
MVRAMDSLSAVDFLSKLQKGGKPASSDLKLINTLVGEMGLPENVCNALVFYVLQIKENVLNASYVEKLAGSLVREGCLTAIDALNYLGKTGSSLKKRGKKEENKKTIVPKKEKKEEPVEEKPVVTPSVAPTEEDEEEDDYEALLESL